MQKYTRLIVVVLISIILSFPFIFPYHMNRTLGYCYGWIPGYGIGLAEYLKGNGSRKLGSAANMSPSIDRDREYEEATSAFHGALAIYSMHLKVFPMIEYFEKQMILCGQCLFHSKKITIR